MKEIAATVLTGFITVIIAYFVTVVGNIVHTKCEQLKQKTKSDAFKQLLEKIDYIVQLCVESTNQTFVVDKKIAGTFSDEDKVEAFDQTFKHIETLITDEDKQWIIENFGDFSSFIKNSIENYIGQSKDI